MFAASADERAGKKDRPPAWKERDEVKNAKDPFVPPDAPKTKMKWQEKNDEPVEAVDNGALEAARQKREEKKVSTNNRHEILSPFLDC